MTARVVPLQSHEAGDARLEGTVAERVKLVAELTEIGWNIAKLPWPSYSRATMPVALTTLAEQGKDE